MVGALALNRIGVVYFKKKKVAKSLRFHVKHTKEADSDSVYLAYYNCGVCHRVLGDHQKAHWYFAKALEWAQFREDPHSVSLCHGQLGITSFLGKGHITAKSQSDPQASL